MERSFLLNLTDLGPWVCDMKKNFDSFVKRKG